MKIAIAKWYYMDQDAKSAVIDTNLLAEDMKLHFETALEQKIMVEMRVNDMNGFLRKAEVNEFPCMIDGHLLVVEDPS
jgi:hypothetical protein